MLERAIPVLKGSCACSLVKYQVASSPTHVTYCHCITCRKISGSSFILFAGFLSTSLTWITTSASQPHSLNSIPAELEIFERDGFGIRGFCSSCHSLMYMQYRCAPETLSIAMGSLDEAEGLKPSCHIFTSQKAPWSEINDGLECHERFPPDYQRKIDKWMAEASKERV